MNVCALAKQLVRCGGGRTCSGKVRHACTGKCRQPPQITRMDVMGLISKRMLRAGRLVASAGQGAVYEVDGDRSVLLKVFDRPLSSRDVEKLRTLAAITPRPEYAALPVEVVSDLATGNPIGFVQPYFRGAVPLTRALDSHGRMSLRLPDDLAFRVKLCRLLAEAFARIHAVNLVVGDVSDGNFMLGLDWLRRAWVVYAIDCNSYQVVFRTAQGNAFYPSGVATEEYAAPEVQPTDWATSARSVFSDSFGLGVLAWKIVFNGSHPFAVVTPRSVDAPPLGRRMEDRQFPYRPAQPLPAGWTAPDIQPSPAVLPVEIREMFFRCFSADDPRDRATADEWARAFFAWEQELTPALPLRLLGALGRRAAKRLNSVRVPLRPYLSRVAAVAVFGALTALCTHPEWLGSPGSPRTELRPDNTPRKASRPRPVDPDLFHEPLWAPVSPRKE